MRREQGLQALIDQCGGPPSARAVVVCCCGVGACEWYQGPSLPHRSALSSTTSLIFHSHARSVPHSPETVAEGQLGGVIVLELLLPTIAAAFLCATTAVILSGEFFNDRRFAVQHARSRA